MEHDIIAGARFFGLSLLFILAAVLAFAHRGKVKSQVYNRTRWLLVVGSVVLGVQIILQFVGHFREQSVCLAWIINLMSYAVVIPAYNLGELNLLRAGHNMRKPIQNAVILIFICIALLIVGLMTDTIINDSAPYKTVTCLIAFVESAFVLPMSWRLNNAMKHTDTYLLDEELEERYEALRYTVRSMKWILISSLLTPWIGMSSSLLINGLYGMLIFGLLAWYLTSFYVYGMNMEEVVEVSEDITEAETIYEQELDGVHTEETNANHVGVIIDTWQQNENWLNPDMNMDLALTQMGISAKSLNQYLRNELKKNGYRQWVSSLRIEKALKLLKEYPDYSIETIATMCGFLDRSNFTRSFKTHVGISPSVWQKKHQNKQK